MDVLENQLLETYSRKDTKELLELYKTGDLTEKAQTTLVSVLESRGIKFGEIKIKLDRDKFVTKKIEHKATAEKLFIGSIKYLYLLAALEIMASAGYHAYFGVAVWILLAMLVFATQKTRNEKMSFTVLIYGCLLLTAYFAAFAVSRVAFEGLIAGFIAIWLASRLITGCKNLHISDDANNKFS